MTHSITKALLMGLAAAALAACTKEPAAPTTTASSAHPGITKADPVEPGGYRYYGIYRMEEGGTGLALFDPATRSMQPLGPIVDAENGHPVDHFTGITYYADGDYTLLVTNSDDTHDVDQQNWLWRIDDPLPTEPVYRILAVRVNEILYRRTAEPSVVKNARDIEHYGGDKIAMLRSNADGDNASVFWMAPDGTASDGWPIEGIGAQALTADWPSRRVHVLCEMKKTAPAVLFTYRPEQPLLASRHFGFMTFANVDVGIAVIGDGTEPDRPLIAGVNMRAEMVTSDDDDPHYGTTAVLPTIDMTRVPIE